jgi:hypothetical protein
MTVGRHTGSVSDSARTIVAVHVARLPRTLTRHNVDAHANSERRRRWDASPRLSDSQQGCSSGCARRCVRAGAADPHVGEHRGSDVVATAGAWTHAHQSSARRCDTATPPATIVPRRRHSRQQRGCEQHTRRDVHSAARTLSAMATRRCMGAQSLWGHGSDPRAFAQGPPLHMVLIFGAPSCLPMDAFVFPTGQLELGPEIARGSFGAVSKAKLHGVWVCAKVLRAGAVSGLHLHVRRGACARVSRRGAPPRRRVE